MNEELDIFISCKDTDDKGNETIDLKISREIAKILRSENFKVFLSDQTLSELGSSQYKKTIDEALDLAKAMVVVTSKSEYAESNWVRYEWDTFYNTTFPDIVKTLIFLPSLSIYQPPLYLAH